jgi:hypothetical protein
MEIPIRYSREQPQQQQQWRESQWGGGQQFGGGSVQQQQQPLWQKQQQPFEQQQSQFGREQQQQFGKQQQFGGYRGMQQSSQQQQFKTVNIQGDHNIAELTVLGMALKAEGVCCLKSHMLQILSGDNTGIIQQWIDRVVKPNFEALKEVYTNCGLPLPFAQDICKREQELKQQLSSVRGSILTDTEALTELCFGAKEIAHLYSSGFLVATNEQTRDVFKQCCSNVCNMYVQLKEVLYNQPDFIGAPIVKQLAVQHCSVQERR